MPYARKIAALPKNYPVIPVRYPVSLFRAQLDAAARFLFEGEIKEALAAASIPLDVLSGAADPGLSVAHISDFMQEVKQVIGPEKALQFGHEAFHKTAPLIAKPALPPLSRAVSSSDKLFLRVRESMSGLNRQSGSNFMVKWHGGAESDIFEDTAQHCYGYKCSGLSCETLTGFLQEAIIELAGIQMTITESECMATGALACRWHCQLAGG